MAGLDPEVQGVWAALREEGITSQLATCSEEALEFLAGTQARVLVLDGGLPEDEVRALHQGVHAWPGVPILWVWPEPGDGAAGGGPGSAGCGSRLEEHVAKPVSGAVLALRIKALALQAGFELPRRLAEPAAAHATPSERTGSLIAVYGAKGGVGKSTIAVNLAVWLAQSFGR